MTVKMMNPNGPSDQPTKTIIKHRNSNSSPHLGIIISSPTTISKHIDDVELISFASLSYTSLRDLMPSPQQPFNPSSPTASSYAQFGLEIPIRNHLVKQAAWAYLQPMSYSPSSSAPFSLRRLWPRFSAHMTNIPVPSWLTFFRRKVFPIVSKAFHWLVKAITGKPKHFHVGRGRESSDPLCLALALALLIDSSIYDSGDCAAETCSWT